MSQNFAKIWPLCIFERPPMELYKGARRRAREISREGGPVVRYSPTDDASLLKEYDSASLGLVEELRPLIAVHGKTAKFAQRWGPSKSFPAYCYRVN